MRPNKRRNHSVCDGVLHTKPTSALLDRYATHIRIAFHWRLPTALQNCTAPWKKNFRNCPFCVLAIKNMERERRAVSKNSLQIRGHTLSETVDIELLRFHLNKCTWRQLCEIYCTLSYAKLTSVALKKNSNGTAAYRRLSVRIDFAKFHGHRHEAHSAAPESCRQLINKSTNFTYIFHCIRRHGRHFTHTQQNSRTARTHETHNLFSKIKQQKQTICFCCLLFGE